MQKHRRRTDNDIDISKNCDHHFFYASASKEGYEGVGILIKSHPVNCVKNVTKIDSKMIDKAVVSHNGHKF